MQSFSHQELADRPIQVRGFSVRAVTETEPDNRPWSEAQAIFLGAIFETTGLPKKHLTSGG